jgi:putative heme transporter
VIRINLSPRHLILAACTVAAIWLSIKLWSVILLAGVALLIATALLPFVEWLRRRTGHRPLAVTLVVLSVLGGIALLMFAVAPPLTSQARDLWDEAPELQTRLADKAAERGWVDLETRIRSFELSEVAGPHLVDAGRTAVTISLAIFTVFVLASYFLLDAKRLEQFVYFSTPGGWHRHIRALLPALQRVVGGYIRGQAITSAAISIFAYVLLSAVGVPNPLAFAALAFILDAIPMIGATLLTLPMALAALSVSPTAAGIVVVANLGYQQFEDRVLVPRVYGATMRLPAIAVVLAILAGNELLGITGALIALPVAAAARVVVEYFAAVRKEGVPTAAEVVSPPDEAFAPDIRPNAPAVPPRRVRRVSTTRPSARQRSRVSGRGPIRKVISGRHRAA